MGIVRNSKRKDLFPYQKKITGGVLLEAQVLADHALKCFMTLEKKNAAKIVNPAAHAENILKYGMMYF